MSTGKKTAPRTALTRLLGDYGMLLVLLVLCVLFSILTLADQHPTGTDAARTIIIEMSSMPAHYTGVLILGGDNDEDRRFAEAVQEKLSARGLARVRGICGDPVRIRNALANLADSADQFGLIVTSESFAPIVNAIKAQTSGFAGLDVTTPLPYRWPTFLLPDNIRNVANQITVIAIIAIGMTMVIITAGIDLSVGSLVALSAVVIAWLIGRLGAENASGVTMAFAGLVALLLCGATGAFSGFMVTRFRIPPFIATLAMMQVAAGLAYIISQGKPFYRLPEGFIWLAAVRIPC